MGNSFLDKPITTKITTSDQNDKLRYTTCQMQGWRKYMQDTKITILSLPGYPHLSLFAVFDGHGGDEVSRYVERHFVEQFLKRKSLKQNNISNALKQTFIQMDLLLKSKQAIQEQIKYKKQAMKTQNITKQQLQAGCTAIVVVISPQKIYVANAGDSRAVLFQSDQTKPLSEDHKPELQSEKQRILNSGAQIIEGRVNGNLNLTRSLGDFAHKNVPKLGFHLQPIICLPQIRVLDRTNQEEFLIVGCDGIFQRYQANSDPLMRLLKKELQNKSTQKKKILQKFFDENISKGMLQPHGKDNMTLILIQFLRPE